MARDKLPESCTEDDCTHNVHVREYPRSGDVHTEPHPHAPLMEAICPIHGVILSR